MYRIQHNQSVAGAILIDDIDDGLPNKEVHRIGSLGNPDAYPRDGYANKPKQPCYVPRTQASTGNPTVPGYIDLNQTPRVVLSAGKGKISKLKAAGLVTVTSVLAANVQTPNLTGASLSAGGVLTITGVTLLSVAPDSTTVVITGNGAITLTQAQITGGSGTVTATTITIPASLAPTIAAGTSSVKVIANAKPSNVLTLAAPPTLTTAVKPVGGTLTLTGTNFQAPLTVAITGAGAITLTSTQITGGGGAIAGTSVTIPNALLPGVVVGSSAKVTTNGGATSVVVLT
jgi:hypothetical protein